MGYDHNAKKLTGALGVSKERVNKIKWEIVSTEEGSTISQAIERVFKIINTPAEYLYTGIIVGGSLKQVATKKNPEMEK